MVLLIKDQKISKLTEVIDNFSVVGVWIIFAAIIILVAAFFLKRKK